VPAGAAAAPEWTLADGWIWARLKKLTRDVERLFQNFQYGEAGRQIYEFFWSDFADWYLEIAKLQLAQDGDRPFYTAELMIRVYDIVLRMLHPYTPFVTEELWGYLRGACIDHSDKLIPQDNSWAEALIIARWPEGIDDEGWEQETIKRFQQIQEIVRQIRNLRAERSISPSRRLAAMITSSRETFHTLQSEAGTIAALTRLDTDKVRIIDIEDGQFQKPPGHIALVSGSSTIYLPLAELVDVQEERGRLEKELQEVKGQINRLENMLSGPFAEKAPESVVQKERSRLADYQETAEKINAQLKDLGT
jgi:valyl-tRNA synthetase